MTERKIKGLFLGVPVLSQGSYTEAERLNRDGFGYAVWSLQRYVSGDYITSSVLVFLCLCVVARTFVAGDPKLALRLVLHVAFSITFLIAILRSDISGLALPFVGSVLAYYGLMYSTGFDR